jgi:hypothetical protein
MEEKGEAAEIRMATHIPCPAHGRIGIAARGLLIPGEVWEFALSRVTLQ